MARYTVRMVGSKHDAVRKFGVIDATTGRRVDGVRGGFIDRESAEWEAEKMNSKK